MSVQGMKNLEAAVKRQNDVKARGLRKGLGRAGLFLQRESMKLVPIDTGVLRSSANTRLVGHGAESVAIISYGTTYGVYVHENLEARHKPGTQAKFLEQPFREKRDRLQEIIAEAVRETK